jgi:hypothetical protein
VDLLGDIVEFRRVATGWVVLLGREEKWFPAWWVTEAAKSLLLLPLNKEDCPLPLEPE